VTQWTPIWNLGSQVEHGNVASGMLLGLTTTVGTIAFPAGSTASHGRFLIPNDGTDYYLTITNATKQYTTVPTVTPTACVIRTDTSQPTPSFIQFNYHSPTGYEAKYVGATVNEVIVDRLDDMETRLRELLEYKHNQERDRKELETEYKEVKNSFSKLSHGEWKEQVKFDPPYEPPSEDEVASVDPDDDRYPDGFETKTGEVIIPRKKRRLVTHTEVCVSQFDGDLESVECKLWGKVIRFTPSSLSPMYYCQDDELNKYVWFEKIPLTFDPMGRVLTHKWEIFITGTDTSRIPYNLVMEQERDAIDRFWRNVIPRDGVSMIRNVPSNSKTVKKAASAK